MLLMQNRMLKIVFSKVRHFTLFKNSFYRYTYLAWGEKPMILMDTTLREEEGEKFKLFSVLFLVSE